MTLVRPRNVYTCYDCIWYDQCADDEICEDFSPADTSLDITYYENDLKMRAAVYREIIEEYGDGNMMYDGF